MRDRGEREGERGGREKEREKRGGGEHEKCSYSAK